MVVLTVFAAGARLDQLGWSWKETTLLDALSCYSCIQFKSAILVPQQAKDKQMKNLTTPQAILCGFALVALAIASIPYSSNIVTPAHAAGVQKVAICNKDGSLCADTSYANVGSEKDPDFVGFLHAAFRSTRNVQRVAICDARDESMCAEIGFSKSLLPALKVSQ